MGDKRLANWTDGRVAKLKELWEASLSCSEIAAELGGVTRNAVIGKLHRLGMSAGKRPAKATAQAQTRQPRPHIAKVERINVARPVASGPNLERQPFTPTIVPVQPRNLSFAELIAEPTDTVCKFECSGFDTAPADFVFCGLPSIEGGPYCASHHAVCRNEPPKRKARVYPHELNKGRGGIYRGGRAA